MRLTPMRVLVAAGLALGGVLRLLVWRSHLGTLDGDEAVWGLMTGAVLDGELPAFFWGQAYGGTLEVFLGVPLLGLFPTSVVALRAVPVALTIVAVILLWRVGRRTIGEPAATAAALVFWLWPAYSIWKSIRAHGFYGSGLVLGLLILLLALRLAERRSRSDAVALGLVLGVAGWQTAQIVPIAIAAVCWLVWRRPATLRDSPYALAGVLAGLAPWLVSNIRHDWWSFTLPPGGGTYVSHFRGFVNGTLPMQLGVRVPFEQAWLGGALVGGALLGAAYLAFLVIGARRIREPFGLLVVVALAFPFISSLSSFTWLVDEPRYVYILSPVLALLVGSLLTTTRRALAGVAAAAVLSVAGLLVIADSTEYRVRADGLAVPADFAPLVAALDRLRLDRVYADYWIGYRLTFETDERIVAAQSPQELYRRRGEGRVIVLPQEMRRPAYDVLVRRSPRPGHVVLRGSEDEANVDTSVLREAGYRRVVAGDFVIWAPP